jgi:WD40 repeat protein
VYILGAALGFAWVQSLFLATPLSGLAQSPAAQEGPISFINDIALILKENCFACHDAKKRKGKFDMSTYASLRKGGSGDDPIVPGKPDESPLLDRLTATDKSRMPPQEAGEALPKQKIAVIEKWIAEGAMLDAGLTPQSDILRELRLRWKPPAPLTSYPFAVTITELAFTPDNQKLVMGGHHELTVWDLAHAKLEKRVSTRMERAYALVFLPDGKLAAAGGRPGQEGDVRIYDLHGGNPKMHNGIAILDGVNDPAVMVKQLLETDDAVLCLALSPDGKKLASGGSQDRLVNVWDLTAGYANAKLEQTIENHADWVFGLAFSPNGKQLLTCSRDKTAKVWDLTAKESVITFPGHQNPVYGVAIKADSKVGISGGEDNQVRFWNATGEGKQIRASSGHSKAIFRVVSHPNKPILATCSADTTVRLWNADNGQAVRTLSGHTDWVYAVAFSPDGNLVASGSWNGEVKVWTVADGKLVKEFNGSPGFQRAAASSAPRKR